MSAPELIKSISHVPQREFAITHLSLQFVDQLEVSLAFKLAHHHMVLLICDAACAFCFGKSIGMLLGGHALKFRDQFVVSLVHNADCALLLLKLLDLSNVVLGDKLLLQCNWVMNEKNCISGACRLEISTWHKVELW